MALETAFYIIGIVFMGLSILLVVALLVMVLVIRAKINSIQRTIHANIELMQNIISRASPALKIFRTAMKLRKMLKRRK